MEPSVILSIDPYWCGEIISGRKKYDVRKSIPKLATPFGCLMYCTINRKKNLWIGEWYGFTEIGKRSLANGKVIGEFVCDYVDYGDAFNFAVKEDGENKLEGTGLTEADLFRYLGWEYGMQRMECKPFYKWHISDLRIYDVPKDLKEYGMIRAPQSWCYVNK